MKFNHIPQSSKLYLVLILFAIVLLIFTASMAYRQLKQMQKSADMVTHTYQVNDAIGTLFSHYLRLESQDFRNGLLKGGQLSDEKLNAYMADGKVVFDSLQILVSDNPSQLRRLEEIKILHNTLYSSLITTQDFVNDDGQIMGRASFQTKKISNTLFNIRGINDQMRAEERQLMRTRKADYASKKKLAPIFILLLGFFALFVFIISFLRLYRNKQSIRRSEAFLQNVVATTDNIVNYYEPQFDSKNSLTDFKIVFANDCNRDYFGLEPEKIIGKSISEVFPHLMLNGEFEELVRCYKEQTKVIFDRKVLVQSESMWFESIVTPMTEGILVTARNSTEKESVKEELLTLNEELQIRNLELERINAELKSFNRVSSHDLQEPLRKIQMFISRIGINTEIALKDREYLVKIENATGRMRSLIDNLLKFSQIDTKHEDFEKVDLNIVFNKVKDDLSDRIAETGASLITEILPVIDGIAYQMEQLFDNLISNGLKYSAQNIKPNIVIHSEKVHQSQLPETFFKTAVQYHKLTFTDNGIGFEQGQAEKIFEVFQRLHLKSEYSGTGIGLAICKKIVENHYGYIHAASEPGKGSAFVVYLPVNFDK